MIYFADDKVYWMDPDDSDGDGVGLISGDPSTTQFYDVESVPAGSTHAQLYYGTDFLYHTHPFRFFFGKYSSICLVIPVMK